MNPGQKQISTCTSCMYSVGKAEVTCDRGYSCNTMKLVEIKEPGGQENRRRNTQR